MGRFLAALITTFLLTTPLAGQSLSEPLELPDTVPPWNGQKELLVKIWKAGPEHDDRVIEWIGRHYNDLDAHFIAHMSGRMVARDPDSALEWFALSLVRATYDQARCAGISLTEFGQGMGLTSLFILAGSPMEMHYRMDALDTVKAFHRALNRSDLFSSRVSPMYICSVMPGEKAVKSEGQWPAVMHEVLGVVEKFVRDQVEQWSSYGGPVPGWIRENVAEELAKSNVQITVSIGDRECPGAMPNSIAITNGDTRTIEELAFYLAAREPGQSVDALRNAFLLKGPILAGERRARCHKDSVLAGREGGKSPRAYEWRVDSFRMKFSGQ